MTELVPVTKHLRIGRAWAGLTLFDAVRRAFSEVSPREVFRKARIGEITRNERSCHPLEPVAEGDLLRLVLYQPSPLRPRTILRQGESVTTPAGPFWIVREDEDLLVVSKPAGCASHPALKHSGDTLIERVRWHLQVRREDPFQPALANRLDIETSGIVLVAKTRNAQRRLGRHFQKGLVGKTYLALVAGWPHPAEAEIRIPLLRRADSRERSRLPEDHPRLRGKLQEAATRYRVRQRLEQPLRASLLEVELLTGRTHQIRRHLAKVGHPVAGDARYGEADFNRVVQEVCGLDRMFLHAVRVNALHPESGEPLELEAPLPDDLISCLSAFGVPAESLDRESPLPTVPADGVRSPGGQP